MTRISLLLPCFFLLTATNPLSAGPKEDAIEFFEKKVRPVLAEHCYRCHSEATLKTKKSIAGHLRLDTAEGWKKGGDSGPAIVPGKPAESLLVKAIRYTDDEFKMPPKGKLPEDVIADLEMWVKNGAVDPRGGESTPAKKTIDVAQGRTWWAFRPLTDVKLPDVKNTAAVKTPVDRFLLSKLEAKGVTPNPAADREKLLRRLSFDVLGLPPSPTEIDAFVNDPAPDAYERVVVRILESPHYGERWARHWLDAVRFAESSGYEFDKDRPGAFHYRDFVIKAFNEDLPYDEFVRLQIAGDHLKPDDLRSVSATGFLVAGPYPGQVTAKTLALIRYNHLDDMVSTLGSAMLGLSIGCARCHDHKYDPIPQQDYYRLVAALGRTDSMDRKLDPNPEIYRKAKEAFDREIASFKAARDQFDRDELPKRLASWQAKQTGPVAEWSALDASREKPAIRNTRSFTFDTFQAKVTALRVELPEGTTAGLNNNGVTITPLGGMTKPTPVKLKTTWMPEVGKTKKEGLIVFETPVGTASGTTFTVNLNFAADVKSPIRVAFTTAVEPKLTGKVSPQHEVELRNTALDPKKSPTIVGRWYRKVDEEADKVHRAYDAIAAKEPKANLIDIWSATSGKGGDVHFLIRGEVERKNGVATPGFVQVLTNSSQTEKHWTDKVDPRVALARWLTDADNGAGMLLARVMVNRLWQHHFGHGLVATANDFGVQGDAPSHPELLEYLAGQLVKGGWRLKPIHKLMLESAAYRQTGDLSPAAMKVDPTNRLVWRQSPRRLEAEAIRDSLLAVSGTLDSRQFGAGSLDPQNPRRSVYLTVKRSQMVAMMQMFDAPEPIQSIGERSVTTVPAQSLAFLNSAFVRTRAEKLAARVKSADVVGGVREAFRTALGRTPNESEVGRMQTFLERQAATYGTTGMDRAWTDACQVLLCSNEFVYVD
jgi:hypothetical protein